MNQQTTFWCLFWGVSLLSYCPIYCISYRLYHLWLNCLLSLATTTVAWLTPLLERYFNRDSRTSRRRRTSSPSTWMNLTIRCRSELRRFCWLLLFLLLLAIFRPRPPEISIAVGGMFADESNRERTQHPHDSLITNLGAICATASTSVLICRWVIGSLANVCWWTLTLIFPPALRYTMVIKESKREFDSRLQHSATI